MFEEVKEIIVDNSGVDPDLVTPESKLRSDLGLNSLDIVMIATELEGKFNTTVSEKEIIEVVTVGDIVKLISNNR